MNGLEKVFILIVCVDVSTIAQYVDDSDYEDYQVYDELASIKPLRKYSIKEIDPVQDDFYIINDYEDTVPPENQMYSMNDDVDLTFDNEDDSIEMIRPPYQRLKWFKTAEKVYRYTKHRIPGYDYDELEFIGGGRKFAKCDTRSAWSHCVCQFTCSNPNQVDCYAPCISGCECKEAFVYDEITRLCIPPEMCPLAKNFNFYEQ